MTLFFTLHQRQNLLKLKKKIELKKAFFLLSSFSIKTKFFVIKVRSNHYFTASNLIIRAFMASLSFSLCS